MEESKESWNTVFDGFDPERKVIQEVEKYVGLPPFRERIPDHYIREGVVEPSLCMVKKGKFLRNIKIVRAKRSPLGFDQITCDGAYTKGVKAGYGAAAKRRNGRCRAYRMGRTSELTPSCRVHEYIGAKHGLILGKTLRIRKLHLIMDSEDAVSGIKKLIREGPPTIQKGEPSKVPEIDKKALEERTLQNKKKQEAAYVFQELCSHAFWGSDDDRREWTWEQAVLVITNDKRYGTLKILGERKEPFNEYLVQMIKEEAERRDEIRKNARKNFVKMLEESTELKSTTVWHQAVSMFQGDERFGAVRRGSDRFDMFRKFTLYLQEKKGLENGKLFSEEFEKVYQEGQKHGDGQPGWIADDGEEGWELVASSKVKNMMRKGMIAAAEQIAKYEEEAWVKRVEGEVLEEIKKLIFENWMDGDGKSRILVEQVFREANFMADDLAHIGMESDADEPIMRFFGDPDFFIESNQYFEYRDWYSAYIRFSRHFQFVRDRIYWLESCNGYF